MFIKDPKTGLPSPTLTMLVAGFSACMIKLIMSGVDIHGIHLGLFGGGDFATAIGALGAIYVAKGHSDNISNTYKDKDDKDIK